MKQKPSIYKIRPFVVTYTFKSLVTQIPMSEAYLGSVINALAKPIYGRGEISASESRLIKSFAPDHNLLFVLRNVK
ncbi:Uncharacterized protein TCM_044888 [Theobroma cacao]|uniref:Uncharacterized protein n=1 Tax=Theobroma cacao TaxID=3641 RepID=A0A061FRL6_THECC|nr:Uncharacterized protein TCM_044888 [Theobroma cacao]